MKRTLLWGLSAIFGFSVMAQQINTITSDNYASEAFKNVFIEMPGYREISSGSKLVVTYDSNVPAEMQGAFEHAVRLWEEVLPMTLPIHLTVKLGTIRGSGNVLSKVAFDSFIYSEHDKTFSAPISMIKGVCLQEYHARQSYRFIEDISETSIFEREDIIITYNNKMIEQFDYSLDGEPNLNKYDFVTVALRDIAVGLGFTSQFTAEGNRLEIMKFTPTPFASLIINSLGTTDPYKAFANATKGSLTIPLTNWGNIEVGTLNLYAPNTWSNSTSLRFFIPDDKPITKLLTYDFGKGYVMRDLSGANWRELFECALDWRRVLTVGNASGSVSQSGNSDDVLPYKGTVTLSFDDNDRTNTIPLKKGQSVDIKPISSVSDMQQSLSMTSSSFPAKTYCRKYDALSPDGPFHCGLSLSVLKKDGSWDCIYKNVNSREPVTVNIENLALNFDESEYARGTTGGLRYRLTRCEEDIFSYAGGETPYNYTTKYFTRDFIPQKAFLKYTPEQSTLTARKTTLSDDDWFVDVKVGISNLEGTTKVIVEQLDEGEELPFQYEVSDFRKGYFIANLDRECSTTLTVVSYNANGYQRSNTIVIPAIGYPSRQVTFDKSENTITLSGLSDDDIASGNISYTITNITNANRSGFIGTISDNRLDIGNLAKGIYVLSIDDGQERIATYKFAK